MVDAKSTARARAILASLVLASFAGCGGGGGDTDEQIGNDLHPDNYCQLNNLPENCRNVYKGP